VNSTEKSLDQKASGGDLALSSFGQKHLIKCRCVLPQMKNSTNSVAHQFLVFSEIENGEVKQKYAQCNNCGVIHKVIDICRSEIMNGKEAMSSMLSIEDIRSSLTPPVIAALDRHNCDLPTWEHAKFVIEKKKWGDVIILTSEVEGSEKVIKYMRVLGEGLFKIDTHIRKEIIGE
jgi:hypothetical protein